jgi:glyoxylase-like metal-dependent hydrolase (beta-lactamase superfamily II)
MTTTIAPGVDYFDLNFQNTPRIIATVLLHGPHGSARGGVAIVDPGPSSTLSVLNGTLEQKGIGWRDVESLVLTHIHLDHAGASGTLVAAHPHLRVFVHEAGAPHLVAPDKLVASATRLWGDAMHRLWGEVRPVPAAHIQQLKGGEKISTGGRTLDVAYTPGHASHHVSYLDSESGVAFVGDTAGVQLGLPGKTFVLPPTPPPDIDLEVWRESIERIDAWRAETLFVTHFGPAAPSRPHLAELRSQLTLVGRLAKESLEQGSDDLAHEVWFHEALRSEIRARLGDDAAAYEVAAPFNLNWRGLARYWRKKA